MPSNHLILCRPLLLLPPIFPSIRVCSDESVLHIRWPKYWSFSFMENPMDGGAWWASVHGVAKSRTRPSVFPSIRVFSDESVLRIRWPKYWSFSCNISPSNEYSGLISFGMDWLDFLAVQGTQESSTVQKHQFFITQFFYGPTLTSIHDYWKNHIFD